jgi:imidazole glycerol phosphate synthase subunit HisF
MRIGALLLFYNGLCYQSYGWSLMRPLGDLHHAVKMLEAYQIDEVAIIRPVRKTDGSEVVLRDMRELHNLKTMTPISFGGGLRSQADIGLLPSAPLERLILSSAYLDRDDALLLAISSRYGRQAMQAMLPVTVINGVLSVFHCREDRFIPLEQDCMDYCARFANEIILYDVRNEGVRDAFDWSITSAIGISPGQLILAGGVGKNTAKKAAESDFAAVLVENRILHQEFSVRGYRRG